MKSRCILIRHAKTAGNEEGRYIGRTDEKLSFAGAGSARKKREQISLIIPENACFFSGPQLRTRETFDILFPDETARIIDQLTETDFGQFEGKNYAELNGDPDYQRFIDSGGSAEFPGGERRADFISRSVFGFNSALDQCTENETAVIVCHGGNIMSIMSSITGKDYFDFQVPALDGYILEMTRDDEGISDLTYSRISDWISG